MQGDAISRSAVLEMLRDEFNRSKEYFELTTFEYRRALYLGKMNCSTCARRNVMELPSLDVAPVVHAHWVYDPDGMDFNLGAWVCSRCKVKNDNLGGLQRINPYLFSGSRYCPNCGAKMDALRNDDVPLPEPPKEGNDEQHHDGL